MKFDKKVEILQKKYGFIVVFFDDASGCWFEKEMETELFGIVRISINIDDGKKEMDYLDGILVSKKDDDYGLVDIIDIEFSFENLDKVIEKFKTK